MFPHLLMIFGFDPPTIFVHPYHIQKNLPSVHRFNHLADYQQQQNECRMFPPPLMICFGLPTIISDHSSSHHGNMLQSLPSSSLIVMNNLKSSSLNPHEQLVDHLAISPISIKSCTDNKMSLKSSSPSHNISFNPHNIITHPYH